MKSMRVFMIICIALMSIAAIAGAISYVSGTSSGRLATLYKEEAAPPVAEERVASRQEEPKKTLHKTDLIAEESSNSTGLNSKLKKHRKIKKVDVESFSRAIVERRIGQQGYRTSSDTSAIADK